ncbi:hypothetical protein PTKIN_Ptkin14bG0003200 [Pterospermum kingtungense]
MLHLTAPNTSQPHQHCFPPSVALFTLVSGYFSEEMKFQRTSMASAVSPRLLLILASSVYKKLMNIYNFSCFLLFY